MMYSNCDNCVDSNFQRETASSYDDCDYDVDVNDILAAMKKDREENRRIRV